MSDHRQAPQHRPEWRRCERGTSTRSDHLGDGVGLLRGEASLLEREGGDVARGVDVVRAGGTAVPVHGDEPVRVGREPDHARADQERERDDSVGEHDRASGQDELPVPDQRRHR